ncbi:MAG TPA: pirin family protein [Steroidobacteraceae bacterium]|nr:pirin family protein [Steroidobacteraceae bacterium]
MGTVLRVLEGRLRDLGGFSVRRVLPADGQQTVGPFIFFDHMGPAIFAPGEGVDVRPHPHIGLATVTYLFEGEFMHRDSLGSAQLIRPGDVNWMVAGRGIAHSERTPPELRRATAGAPIHGIQTWIALPTAHEETPPSFSHHPAADLPEIMDRGSRLRVIAGEAYGARAPAAVFSPMFYVEAVLDADATIELPGNYQERAAYVVEGGIEVAGERYGVGKMTVFAAAPVTLRALRRSRVMLLGGSPLDGPRHIWWNFVSSSRERIERAKLDWREDRFAAVSGDPERIPLPET